MATIQLMVRAFLIKKNNNDKECSCALKREERIQGPGNTGGGEEGAAKSELAARKAHRATLNFVMGNSRDGSSEEDSGFIGIPDTDLPKHSASACPSPSQCCP